MFGALLSLTACEGSDYQAPKPSIKLQTPAGVTTVTTATEAAWATATFSIKNPPQPGSGEPLVQFRVEPISTAFLVSAQAEPNGLEAMEVKIQFRAPNTLGVGTYTTSITAHACSDLACTVDIKGSPMVIPVTLVVGDEFGARPVPTASQQSLAHDVVDAEYSSALDAIVMVSNLPSPALHLFNPADGTEQSIALGAAPLSVSVAPNGLTAAVGHSGKVAIIDLTNLGNPVAATTLLDVTSGVGDVVLAGNGYVHVFPAASWGWAQIRSIHIASNTETLSTGQVVHEGTVGKVHPSGTRMYGADNGLSPDDIERYGIALGTASNDYDSPYHGEYRMCGNLWMRENGTQIYTGCGVVLRSSDTQSQDMRYAGTLDLTPADYYWTYVKSLSQSEETGEILALDEDTNDCGEYDDACYTRLGVYEHEFLNLRERFSLAGITVAGSHYVQRGRFVFHSANGSQRYLISSLVDFPNPAQAWRISRLTIPAPLAVPAPGPAVAPIVNASDEAGLLAAPLTAITREPHDVVDAEFSAALNAIVMVSSFPTNALYVHDLVTRTERSIALAKPPTAVSIAQDGLHAAVGHDAMITVVDLAASGAAAPFRRDLSARAYDIVMGANGYAYAIPSHGQNSKVHSVNLATNVETFSTIAAGDFATARLHPSGTKMYGAAPSGYPSRLERYSTDGGTAQVVNDWAEISSGPGYGNLWYSATGAEIYTAGGKIFQASDVPADDMVAIGQLQLDEYSQYLIRGASIGAGSEIATVDANCNRAQYDDYDLCNSHVSLYAGSPATLGARYSLSPLMVGAESYDQHGLYVFHNAAGNQRFVVSRLRGMTDPYAEFYISRLQ